MKLRQSKGFTLLEVLVAIAVLSVMSVMAYGGLERVIDARQKTDQQAKMLSDLQMTFSLMQKDFEQVVNRRTRDRLGSILPSFKSIPGDKILLSLVANNRSSFQTNNHSSRLQKIEYLVEDNKLKRIKWDILDQAHDSEAKTTVLLEDVEAIDFSFYSEGKMEKFWPLPSGVNLIELPRAVDLEVSLKNGMQLQRLFLLPGKLGV